LDSVSNNAASGGLYLTTPPGTGAGAHSLALNVDGTTGASIAQISLDFCPGGALATGIQGQLHVSVWFKPTDGNGSFGGPGDTSITDGNGTLVGVLDTACPAGVWFDVPSRSVLGVSVKHVEVAFSGLADRKGVLYFDNIYFD
jgi:hypothetical protein